MSDVVDFAGGPAEGTRALDLDRAIGRLLTIGTYVSVGLLGIGVLLMARAGISPTSPSPSLDVAAIPSQIAALQPEGFLWLGLLAAIATPLARVGASLIGFARGREWRMVAVSSAILGVVALAVALGLAGA